MISSATHLEEKTRIIITSKLVDGTAAVTGLRLTSAEIVDLLRNMTSYALWLG